MLDASVLPAFLLAVFVLAVVPGPDLALIVSHALARGEELRSRDREGHGGA